MKLFGKSGTVCEIGHCLTKINKHLAKAHGFQLINILTSQYMTVF